jgi:hypothetical protein
MDGRDKAYIVIFVMFYAVLALFKKMQENDARRLTAEIAKCRDDNEKLVKTVNAISVSLNMLNLKVMGVAIAATDTAPIPVAELV